MKFFSDVYLLGKKLQAGTYGTVYECVRIKDGRKFAVKTIEHFNYSRKYPVYTISPDALKELYIFTLTRNHPHIVQMQEFFINDNFTYIVMELAKRDIIRLLFDSDNDAKKCMYAILSAVECLHSLGIRYRDVKTTNVLYFGNSVYKLCDFGMSGFSTDNTEKVQSLWWQSPETLRGEPHTYACDRWSVGVLLNDIIHRAYTFETKNSIEMENIVKHFTPSSPIVAMLIQHDPTDRQSLNSVIESSYFDDVCTVIPSRSRVLHVKHQYTAHIQRYLQGLQFDNVVMSQIEWLVEKYVDKYELIDGIELITYGALIIVCKLMLSLKDGRKSLTQFVQMSILERIEKRMVFILAS